MNKLKLGTNKIQIVTGMIWSEIQNGNYKHTRTQTKNCIHHNETDMSIFFSIVNIMLCVKNKNYEHFTGYIK